jgi:hypothetical protein
MGQHQQEIAAGSALVRRMILIFAVAAVMVAMLLVMVSPAFAKGSPKPETCEARAIQAQLSGHGTVPRSCIDR